jgi:hypothetical protein
MTALLKKGRRMMPRTHLAAIAAFVSILTPALPSSAHPLEPARPERLPPTAIVLPRESAMLAERSPRTAAMASLLSTIIPVTLGVGMAAGCSTHSRFLHTDHPAFGCFVAGITLIGTGTIVGPSIGHYYAGETRRGINKMLLRLLLVGGGGLLGGIGLNMIGGSVYVDILGSPSEGKSMQGGGIALLTLGAMALAAGTVLVIRDLVDAPRAARRTNERRKAALTLAPTIAPSSRGTAYAVALGGSF